MGGVQQSTLRMTLLDEVTARAKVINGALRGVQQQARGFIAPFRGLAGQVLAIGGAYVGFNETVVESFQKAREAQAAMTEIGIKADLSATQLQQMNQRLVAIAPNVNQFATDLRGGVDTMLAMGVSADQAMGAISPIGKAATATAASITDLSSASTSAMQNLGVMPTEIGKMLDGMTSAGNAGAFELRDMAQYFPQLTASAQTLGLHGTKGVFDMAAALQIARRGAGDASTAANNLSDFMGKIVTPQTIKNFKKFGVDVTKELQKANKNGVSPIEHFIKLIDKKTEGGKPELLTQLFGDKQTLDFIRPMIAGMKDYLRIRGDAENATGAVDDAFRRRMGDAEQKIKSFWVAMENLRTAAGANLLGPISRQAEELAGVLNTLDQRFTVFDRLKASAEGFWKGLGFGSDTGAGSLKEFIFGVKDASKAADEYGRAFGQFYQYGQDLRSLTSAINESPVLKFLTELGATAAAMGISKWFKLFAVASAIKAIVDAAKGANSIGEFIEKLKGLSALEWAGIGAGLLMIAARAKNLLKLFESLRKAAPKVPATVPKAVEAVGSAMPGRPRIPGGRPGTKGPWGTVPGESALPAGTRVTATGVQGLGVPRLPGSAAPASVFSRLRAGGSNFLKGGVVTSLLQMAGEGAIRELFERSTGKPFVEPPDYVGRGIGWLGDFATTRKGSEPDRNVYSPFANLRDQRAAGEERPVRIDASSIAEMTRPAGVQDVRVTNQQPPNINIHAPITITGVSDPQAAADAAIAKLGAQIKARSDAAFSD